MAQVIYIVERLLAGQISLTTAVNQIRALLSAAATFDQAETIQLSVQTTELAVVSGPHDLAVLDGKLDALAALLAAARSDILAALAPVTLPPTPPPTWGGPTAEAVWDYYPPTGNGRQAATLLVNAGALAQNMGAYAVLPINGKPAFGYQGSWDSLYHPASVIYPEPDWTDIRPDDTRLSWLIRTDLSGLTWELGAAGDPIALANPGDPLSNWIVVCLFSDAEFALWRSDATPRTAPVWPGLDKVTLGAPVALGPNVSITGPLDGLLVAVTIPPTNLGEYTIGGLPSYYRLGYVTFVSDDGEVEPTQGLGWTQALYCPRTMTRAASALVKAKGGAGGTVTPWVRL